jgi:hypothetical protein
MKQTIEEMLSHSFHGFNIEAFRELFRSQPEFDADTNSLIDVEMGFDSPNLNSNFVHFIFLGKHGQYIINELDWEFGLVGKEFLGMKLFEDMRREAALIGPSSTKQQIELRIDRVVRNGCLYLMGCLMLSKLI